MSNEPQGQPEPAKRGSEQPEIDSILPKGRHSPTPHEDAEWDGRMDELEIEREELHENEVVQPGTIEPHDLANIVKRLQALADASKELGQEQTRLNAHLEEALLHLNQAALEVAEERRK